MDKIYPISLFAIAEVFGQISPSDAASWENVGFKGFLIIVVISLACYQIYRDRCDRDKADVRHAELRTDLKQLSIQLHNAELAHTRLEELNQQQLSESHSIRQENLETFRRQWDLFAKDNPKS
jgi:hypothetical protein